MKQVVIIGNGIAGITAARHIRKLSDFAITVISSETQHFFSRTALMYVYMGHLKFEHIKPYEDWFWKKNRINLVFDHVEHVDVDNKTLILRSQNKLAFDQLIIATGSSSNLLDVPGRHAKGVQALYSYQDLELMQANTVDIKRGVIVGGGLIGVEMAEMIHARKINTAIVIREAAFWNNVLPIQEAKMISRHIMSHGIEIFHDDELAEIVPDARGRVGAVRTKHGKEIDCQFVGIAVGVHPNVGWLSGGAIELRRGVVVNEYLETNIPGIYAIGDCVERIHAIDGRNNIEQVWYTARMMGETVAQTLCGDKTPYYPGPWFNSAKFFDIEFQTYGKVGNQLSDDEDELYWEHHSGRKAVHIVWQKSTNRFLGINTFGIRLRHQCFDNWLRNNRSVQYVTQHLREANFDPEFSSRHEDEIVSLFLEKCATI